MSEFLKSSTDSSFLGTALNSVWRETISAAKAAGNTVDEEINLLYGRDKDHISPRPLDMWATWWLFTEPDMDTVYKDSGDYLDKWLEEKKLSVTKIDGDKYIFQGRFEWKNYGYEFLHTDGVVAKGNKDNTVFFVDFMSGLSWDAIELLTSARDASMTNDQFEVIKADESDMAAPVPDTLFGGYEEKYIYWNYLWFAPDKVEDYFYDHAGSLEGTDKPKNLHDWMRLNVLMEDKFPVPGEFMGLAVRIFPEYPWGQQESNPFIFSGNFMDTAYKLRGRITEITEATANRPYKMYRVKTHLNQGEEISICATDFEDYNVDDYVTIIKDVSVIDASETFNWETLAKSVADPVTWMILPTTYYDLDEAP